MVCLESQKEDGIKVNNRAREVKETSSDADNMMYMGGINSHTRQLETKTAQSDVTHGSGRNVERHGEKRKLADKRVTSGLPPESDRRSIWDSKVL